MKITRLVSLLLALAFLAASAHAKVTRLEIISRTDVAGGKSFGAAGPYEKIVGKLYFEVDPKAAHNRQIVDLDKAPRNPRGMVEFAADLFILRPKDPTKANGAALVEHPAARAGQADENSTPVSWMPGALEVAPALEAVQTACDSSRGQHEALEQLRRREVVGRSRDPQRAQHPDVAAVQAETAEDLLLVAGDVEGQAGDPGGDLIGADLETRLERRPALQEIVGPVRLVLGHRGEYME